MYPGCWVWEPAAGTGEPYYSTTEVIDEDPSWSSNAQSSRHAPKYAMQTCAPLCAGFGGFGAPQTPRFGSRDSLKQDRKPGEVIASTAPRSREALARIERLRKETEANAYSREGFYEEYPDFSFDFRGAPRSSSRGNQRKSSGFGKREEEDSCCGGRDDKRTCDVGSDLCGDLDGKEARKRHEISITD